MLIPYGLHIISTIESFYDLCDERGMAVWAEIPYISRHMPGGRENTVSQMKELIYQNINHPSIIVLGLVK